MNSYMSFIQMDRLINYINSNSTYNASIFYSTLYDYTKAVNALNLTWNLEETDFFNYCSGPNDWWTGYFVSRPELKAYTRFSFFSVSQLEKNFQQSGSCL